MTKNICKNSKCNKELSPEQLRRHTKYCSTSCRNLINNRKYGQIPHKTKLSSNTKGAVAELVVCAHLLKKGFEVFRALSPACSCDLILLYKGKPFRIEVRSLGRSYKNKIPSNLRPRDKGKFDILASVFYGDRIVYDPPLNALKNIQRQCSQDDHNRRHSER